MPEPRIWFFSLSRTPPGQEVPLDWLRQQRAEGIPGPEGAIEVLPGVRVRVFWTGDVYLPDGSTGQGTLAAVWPAQWAGEFPPREQVPWGILQAFYGRSHPLIRDADPDGVDKDLDYGFTELLYEAKAVHHLLDLAGVPQGYGIDTTDIDCRTLLAVMAMGNLRERLARISARHAREAGPAGTVGDDCAECGQPWKCGTRRMADGEYGEEEDRDR